MPLCDSPAKAFDTSKAKIGFHVLTKPIGPICNLDCAYCFYLKKEGMFPQTRDFRMDDATLEALVKSYIESQPDGIRDINFAWQGGEPTLMGIPFFEKVLALQETYRKPGVSISNAIQTNGTRLDDEWGAFLKQHDVLVGISIDGPRELHDKYRWDKLGRGSFDAVMRGLDVLQRHKVEYNTLTVVQADNSQHPTAVYQFLRDSGSRFWQFIPIVEHDGCGVTGERSVTAQAFGDFMISLFDQWLANQDVGNIFIQHVDNALGQVMGNPSSTCVHARMCGNAIAMEHNGNVYSCDHYVTDANCLGNIQEAGFGDMLNSAKQREFGQQKSTALPRQCQQCDMRVFCEGGCPKDRIDTTTTGEPGLNILCDGYYRFFKHMKPTLEKMATCLRHQLPASEYRNLDQHVGRVSQSTKSAGRNDPCPCGSGKKFKKCCA